MLHLAVALSTPTQMASRINALEKGSLNYIYCIQQTPFSQMMSMVAQLDAHIKLVGHQGLVDLAKQLQ